MLRHASPLSASRRGLNVLRTPFSTSTVRLAADPAPSPVAGPSQPRPSTSEDGPRADRTQSRPPRSTLERRPRRIQRDDEKRASLPQSSKVPQRQRSLKSAEDTTAGTPFVRSPLGEQVATLAANGDLPSAVQLVHNAPHDSRNISVWNDIIQYAMEADQPQLAYDLYDRLKQRLSPNSQTFRTIFLFHARHMKNLKDVPELSKAHQVYVDMVEYIDKNLGRSMSKPCSEAVRAYLEILGRAKLFERLIDVYKAWKQYGSTTHTPHNYATVLLALKSPAPLSQQLQNISHARFVWQDAVEASEKHGFSINSYMIQAILDVLREGQVADRAFALDIARDFLGFVPPGHEPVAAKVPLDRFALLSVLRLCLAAHEFSLCLHYLNQAISHAPGVIDHSHIDCGLEAHAALANLGSTEEGPHVVGLLEWLDRYSAFTPTGGIPSHHLDPVPQTYGAALIACLRGADWASALRLYGLQTQRSAAAFLDYRGAQAPPVLRAWHTSLYMRIALASGDRGNMRQALRMFDCKTREIAGLRLRERHPLGSTVYQQCVAVIELVDAVLPDDRGEKSADADEMEYVPTPEEVARWRKLRSEAKKILAEHPHLKDFPVPKLELPPGTLEDRAALDEEADTDERSHSVDKDEA